jgi:hypothetical protein
MGKEESKVWASTVMMQASSRQLRSTLFMWGTNFDLKAKENEKESYAKKRGKCLPSFSITW